MAETPVQVAVVLLTVPVKLAEPERVKKTVLARVTLLWTGAAPVTVTSTLKPVPPGRLQVLQKLMPKFMLPPMVTASAEAAVVENSVLATLIAVDENVSPVAVKLPGVPASAPPVRAEDASKAPPSVKNVCLFIIMGSP